MKIKLTVLGVALLGVFALAGCAAPAPDDADYNSENLDSSYDEEYDNQDYWESDESDLNSRVVSGRNGVTTITVTLNNGDTVECVSYDTLVCFPETLVPAPAR